MSSDLIDATLKYIEKIILSGKIKRFVLDWFGGEPLLCYNNVMIPLASAAKKICDNHNVSFESGITTNGYLINDDIIRFFKDINMQSIQITLDGKRIDHNEIRFTSNDRKTYQTIVKNICKLAASLSPDNLALRINYTSNTFDDILEIIDSFPIHLRSRITVLLQQVWQDKDNAGSISIAKQENTKLTYKNAGFKVDPNILNCKGYTCYADLFNQAVINYDGKVFKCTARNFDVEESDGILTAEGDIIWNDLYLKKIIHSTLENEKCLNCKYLPICSGPCSQKMSLVGGSGNIDKYCFLGGIESTLDFIMDEFAETNIAISPILEYRA